MSKYIDIVFDASNALDHPSVLVFVEVEDDTGKSIRGGEWVDREDGYTVLRIQQPVDIRKQQRIQCGEE